MTKPKQATASNVTVDAELKTIRLELEELRERDTKQKTQIASLTQQLTEANQVIERDLKVDLVRRIKSKSIYNDADLEDVPIEKLQQIDATLSMGKLKTETSAYQSIHAGAASVGASNMTVGNLHGKTRKEILDLGGEF